MCTHFKGLQNKCAYFSTDLKTRVHDARPSWCTLCNEHSVCTLYSDALIHMGVSWWPLTRDGTQQVQMQIRDAAPAPHTSRPLPTAPHPAEFASDAICAVWKRVAPASPGPPAWHDGPAEPRALHG